MSILNRNYYIIRFRTSNVQLFRQTTVILVHNTRTTKDKHRITRFMKIISNRRLFIFIFFFAIRGESSLDTTSRIRANVKNNSKLL